VLVALAARDGPVGLLGLSLGALAAALAATAPEPVERVALVAPPDLGSVLGRTPIGERYRGLARRAGAPLPTDELVLRDAFRCFDPGARRPTAARVFVATGTEDIIVPPEGPLALAAAWGAVPRLYRRGHLSLLFACGALRRDLSAFLAAPTSSRGPSSSRPPSDSQAPPSCSGTRREP
jgi:pimeloyl-ACP methyl ester carboxylesterase